MIYKYEFFKISAVQEISIPEEDSIYSKYFESLELARRHQVLELHKMMNGSLKCLTEKHKNIVKYFIDNFFDPDDIEIFIIQVTANTLSIEEFDRVFELIAEEEPHKII